MISKKKRSIRKYDSYLRSKNAMAQNKLIVTLNAGTGAAYETMVSRCTVVILYNIG
jgi:hypothetical protein